MIATKYKWIRVNKQHPCSVCGRVDYDTYCVELGYACCMRVSIGAIKQAGNGGWLHKLDAEGQPRPVYQKMEKIVTINAPALWKSWWTATKPETWKTLGELMGVEWVAFEVLGCWWANIYGGAYCFPMRNGKGEIVGLRLRNKEGDYFAVKGSRAGLFIPQGPSVPKTIYLVEGISDCAAALTMGLYAIGRPSCLGQENDVSEFIKLNQVNRVVIVADADDPGVRGAEKLQATLKVSSVLLIPMAKDLRECLRLGMTKEDLENQIKGLVWTRPKT